MACIACAYPGGKTPSGERAPQEGRAPRCFHTNDPLKKKDRQARHGGRITRHAERRCKTSLFSMSHRWKEQIRRPKGGLGPGRLRGREDAAGAAPSLPCSQRSPGCSGVCSMESPRGSGCGEAPCAAQAFAGFSRPSFPQLFPVETKPSVPFTVSSGLFLALPLSPAPPLKSCPRDRDRRRQK